MASNGPKATGSSWLRALVDYGPLAAFFIVYWLGDLIAATMAIMAATAVVLVIALVVERRVPRMPLVTAAVGSEMCIRDSRLAARRRRLAQADAALRGFLPRHGRAQ